MVRVLLQISFLVCLGVLLTFPSRAAAQAPARPVKAEEELVEKVRKAIDNGVKFLKKEQSPQGNWEGIVLNVLADMEGGVTSLVTLALLNSGVKPTDPVVAKSLTFLRGIRPKKTYVVGLQTMVFEQAREERSATDSTECGMAHRAWDRLEHRWQSPGHGRGSGRLELPGQSVRG